MLLTAWLMVSKMEQARLEPAAPAPTMDPVIWDLPGRRVELGSLVSGGLKAAPLDVTIA